MEIGKNRPFWEYHPVPSTMKDFLGRLALEPVNRLIIGAVKPSYNWTWERVPFREDLQGTLVLGDPNAFPINNVLGSLRAVSRWGWQEARVITPNIEKDSDLRWWFFHWSSEDKSFLERCTVGIRPYEAIKILLGPGNIRVYGMGIDNHEVPLQVSERISRSDPRFKNIPIF